MAQCSVPRRRSYQCKQCRCAWQRASSFIVSAATRQTARQTVSLNDSLCLSGQFPSQLFVSLQSHRRQFERQERGVQQSGQVQLPMQLIPRCALCGAACFAFWHTRAPHTRSQGRAQHCPGWCVRGPRLKKARGSIFFAGMN